MDFAQSFAISATGMALERTRVEVAALNLANAHTLGVNGQAGFQPLRVVARAMPASHVLQGSFTSLLAQGLPSGSLAREALSLPEISVEASSAVPRSIYEPDNPFADAKGFVTHPGVDTATEMVTMMSALRAYEANVVAMNTAKTMALKTLDIGAGA